MNRLIIVLFATLFINKDSYEKFSYSEKSKLEWSDFRGQPEENSSLAFAAASVNTGFTYQWSYNKESEVPYFEYEVDSFCYPLLSWVREGQKTDYLLAHEQLHFDISELHARIMRMRLKEYKIKNDKDIGEVGEDLKRMNKVVERLRASMQEQYDAETDHSKNEVQQEKWNKKVKHLLIYYKAYEKKKKTKKYK